MDLRRPPDELITWIKMWMATEERKEIARKTRRGVGHHGISPT